MIKNFSKLASSAAYRRERREYVCEGEKLLREALDCGAEVGSVIWEETGFENAARRSHELIECVAAAAERTARAPKDVFAKASILENHCGPVFTVRIPEAADDKSKSVIALDGVQDPGNVGTVIRTADALGAGVWLIGSAADPYQPKAVRAAMGSLFRVKPRHASDEEFFRAMAGRKVYSAALHTKALTVGSVDLHGCCVIIGSEGSGVRPEIIQRSGGALYIPMSGAAESLNAAVAAAIVMWEMSKCP